MSTLNRRTVVRGTAWSIPVVAMAAAAPAYAASTDAPTLNDSSFTACKLAGAGQNCQSYRLRMTFGVQPDDTWDITITEITFNGLVVQTLPAPFAVRFDNLTRVIEFCSDSSSPSQFQMTLRYSATNRRTGTTTNLGGPYNLSGVKNC